eukprot:7698511-Ditylum_brightwellii.AAC.1
MAISITTQHITKKNVNNISYKVFMLLNLSKHHSIPLLGKGVLIPCAIPLTWISIIPEVSHGDVDHSVDLPLAGLGYGLPIIQSYS